MELVLEQLLTQKHVTQRKRQAKTTASLLPTVLAAVLTGNRPPGESEWYRFQKPHFDPKMCQILLALLAIVLPPIAVLLDQGCTCDLCINILLTCLGVIPGIIHAWYVILCKEKSVITNVYVQTGNNHGSAPPAYQA